MKYSDIHKAALREMRRKKPNLAKAFKLFQLALDEGDGMSAYALGTWYLHGRYVKKDYAKAVGLLECAAEKNIPDALYDLAICYEKGTGTKKNKKKAYESYLRSALWGSKRSVYEVGRCLYHGIGVVRNKRVSDIWLDRADALGCSRIPPPVRKKTTSKSR